MNRRIYVPCSTGDHYEIHLRGANIVHIYCNHSTWESFYDDLPMVVREEILLAIIEELAKEY